MYSNYCRSMDTSPSKSLQKQINRFLLLLCSSLFILGCGAYEHQPICSQYSEAKQENSPSEDEDALAILCNDTSAAATTTTNSN